MKKKIVFIIIYTLTFAVTVLNLSQNIKHSLFSDINNLPKGSLVSSFPSPKGDKTVAVYLVKNALGEAVRAELKANGKKSNVFWQTGISSVEVYWQNDSIAVINSITLNLSQGGYYDCRNGTSLFSAGAIEGEGFVDEQGNVIPKNK